MNFKNDKKKLYFIIETKNINKENLRNEETQKIKHTEKFFFGNTIQIKFRTQFSNNKIARVIQGIYNK